MNYKLHPDIQVLYLAIILGILLGFSSCSGEHALNQVLANPKLKEKAYKAILPEHPCVTSDIVIKGGINLSSDTVYIDNGNEGVSNLHDGVWHIDPNYKSDLLYRYMDTNFVAYTYYDTVKMIVNNTIHRTDTIIKRDVRYDDFLQSKISERDGVITERDKQLKDANKRGDKWLTYFIILCVLSVGSWALKLYLGRKI